MTLPHGQNTDRILAMYKFVCITTSANYTMPSERVEYHRVARHINPTLGCMLSHRDVICDAKNADVDGVFIFEDDCVLTAELDELVGVVEAAKENAILFSATGGAHLMWGDYGEIVGRRLIRVNYYFTGSHCVFIGREYYDAVLGLIEGCGENDEVDVDVYSKLEDVYIVWPFMATVSDRPSTIRDLAEWPESRRVKFLEDTLRVHLFLRQFG